jgi:hypothetical protein
MPFLIKASMSDLLISSEEIDWKVQLGSVLEIDAFNSSRTKDLPEQGMPLGITTKTLRKFSSFLGEDLNSSEIISSLN